MANNDYVYLTTSDGTRVKPVTDLAAINLITKDGIEVSSNTIKLKASVSGPSAVLGGVIVNQGVDHGIKLVNSSGTVSVSAGFADSSGGFGVVTIGSNISISNGTVSVANADTNNPGVVQLESDISGATGSALSRPPTVTAVKTYVAKEISSASLTPGTVVPGTDEVAGIVRFATDVEASAGTASDVAMTPAGVAAYVSNYITIELI